MKIRRLTVIGYMGKIDVSVLVKTQNIYIYIYIYIYRRAVVVKQSSLPSPPFLDSGTTRGR